MVGEKTALEMANQARPLELEDDAEQIDLLDAMGLPRNDNVIAIRAAKQQLGPGRPAGSRNKRTVEMARYLLSRYRSPLETLAQIQAQPVDELAAALGCTKVEALQEIRLAAIALKDHLHSKMPVAVDVKNTKVVHMTMVVEAPSGRGVGLADEIIDLAASPSPAEGGQDAD